MASARVRSRRTVRRREVSELGLSAECAPCERSRNAREEVHRPAGGAGSRGESGSTPTEKAPRTALCSALPIDPGQPCSRGLYRQRSRSTGLASRPRARHGVRPSRAQRSRHRGSTTRARAAAATPGPRAQSPRAVDCSREARTGSFSSDFHGWGKLRESAVILRLSPIAELIQIKPLFQGYGSTLAQSGGGSAGYSTVTDFARLRGLSTSLPRSSAAW